MRARRSGATQVAFVMRALCLIYWGTTFICNQYMSIYLRGLSFTDDLMVGITLAVGYCITTVSQLFWGNVADRSKTKNSVLVTTTVCTAAGLLLLILPEHTGFLTLLPAIFFLYFFLSIPAMLIDTILVENIDKLGVPFGTVKCFSSGGACLMALLLFLVSLKITLRPITAFIMACAAATLSLVPAILSPKTGGHAYGAKKDRKISSLGEILHNRRMVLLLCYLLLVFIGIQAVNVFMGVYFATEDGLNAGLGMYGLFCAVLIGCETLFMTLGNRFIISMDIDHVFILVGIAACVRSFIWFVAPNVYVLLLNAITQALLFAPLWTRLTPYVNDIVSMEIRATGQAAWTIVTLGIAPMVGAALGGVVAGSFGIRSLFAIMTLMLFVVVIVFYFLFRHQRRLEAQTTGGGE